MGAGRSDCCRSRQPAGGCDVRVWVVWNAQRALIGDSFGSVVCDPGLDGVDDAPGFGEPRETGGANDDPASVTVGRGEIPGGKDLQGLVGS